MTRRGQRLRWPDRLSERWEELALGEDEHGVWGCLPPLAPIEISHGDVVRFRNPVLVCYPRNRTMSSRSGRSGRTGWAITWVRPE
jgi:hypothetical protein